MLAKSTLSINLREKQQVPKEPWTHWIICAGRGFGKTLAGSMAVNKLIESGEFIKAALIGHSLFEVRNIMIEGVSGLLNINNKITYFSSNRFLSWPNGGGAIGFSGEFYNKIRGFQFDLVWIDELAKIKNGESLWDQLNFSLRLGSKCKFIITTTPRNSSLMKKILNIPGAIITYGSSYENEENLSSTFFENINQYEGTFLGDQEIYGKLIDQNDLWAKGDIVYVFRNHTN